MSCRIPAKQSPDDDYQMVRDRRSAFNGLVQGLLLTRHMLFVGFGMNDPNVENLVLDLEKAISDARVPTHPKLGTVLQISDKSEPLKPPPEQPPPPPQIDWSKRFHVQDLVDTGEPTGVGARRSELLLDALVAHTSERHAHLLDEDFEGLFSDAEQRARVKAQKFAEELRAIEPSDARDKMLTMLGQLGLRVAQASDTRVRDRRRTTRKSRGG